ncbi:hypothetical protein D3C76_625890 [compost metagenome]
MHAAPVDVAVLEYIGVVGDILLGPGAQGKSRGVLQQFQTAARHRERCAAGFADHPFAVIHQTRDAGVLASGLADRVVVTEIPMRGIDWHFVGARVQLEQGFLAIGQVGAVLRDVLPGDHEQRFFVRVRIHRVVACALEINVGRCPQPLAAECWNAAVGIAGLFCAQARQVVAQSRDVLRCGIHRADGTASQQQHQRPARGLITAGHFYSPWIRQRLPSIDRPGTRQHRPHGLTHFCAVPHQSRAPAGCGAPSATTLLSMIRTSSV